MNRMSAYLFAALILAPALSALAVVPGEMLADPGLEARARAVGKDLRCLVCQNQSIDDSDAELARDLRRLLRDRLAAGDTDAQARQYLVDRYGDYVLLKPPFKPSTLPLWLGPGLLLAAGVAGFVLYFRRRSATADSTPEPLSGDERHRIASLIGEEEAS